MAQLALGIIRSGNSLSFSVVNRMVRQKTLKFSRTFPLNADSGNPTELVDEAVSILSRINREEKLRKARVIHGVLMRDLLWNMVDMPPVSRQDIRQILQFELDAHLPMAPDDCIYDVQIVESMGGTTNRTLLVAADAGILEQARELSARSDLGLDSLTPAAAAIIRTIPTNEHTRNDSGIRVLLCATSESYEVILLRNGKFLTGRYVLPENPWKNESNQGEDTQTTADDLPTTIIKNIQLALLSVHQISTLDTVPEVMHIGTFPDALLNEIKHRYPTAVFRPFELPGFFDAQTPYSEIAATCLALAVFDDDEETINLLPHSDRPVRRETARILIGAAAGALAAAMILVGASNYWRTSLQLLETDARIALLENRVNQITDINRRFTSIQDARQFFMTKSVDYPGKLDVLLEVTRLLPAEDNEKAQKVWLESFEIEKQELTIRGDSDSPEGLLNLLEESTFFEKVKFDGTVSGTRFTIKASLSKLTAGEDLEDGGVPGDDSTGTAPATPAESSDASTPSPVATVSSDEESDGDDSSGDNSEPLPDELEGTEGPVRGPAFPRMQETEPEDPAGFERENMEHVDPLTPEEQAELDTQTREEDMEAMKKNLFDFIRERKESTDFDPAEHRHEEPPDPDEAAANFLEFLQAAAESGEGSK
ncbi:hypothetical protein JXA80_12540 [bacterium]|nr:hypothetical protein [candidate division CSSED10-310 bacterium]